MKKSVLFGLAAVAALGLASCGNSCDKKACDGGKCDDKEELYSGILPSADAQCTVYTLKLDWDDDHNYTDGDFEMIENTLAADTIDASGLKEVVTAYTSGDFRKASKEVNGATVEYIELVPDAKDALGGSSAASAYFVINPDQSLTMVGADLEKSEMPGMNYTLTLK